MCRLLGPEMKIQNGILRIQRMRYCMGRQTKISEPFDYYLGVLPTEIRLYNECLEVGGSYLK